LGRDFKDTVMIVPVDMAFILTVIAFATGPGYFLLHATLSLLNAPAAVVNAVSTVGLVFLTIQTLFSSVKSLILLPVQLNSFSVRSSACFCCANNHEEPGTGRTLPCDRQFVYDALTKWFGHFDPDETPGREDIDAALDAFDEHMQKIVGRKIMQGQVLPFSVRYSHVLMATVGQGILWLDLCRDLNELALEIRFRMFIIGFSMYFFIFPCLFKLAWGLCTLAVQTRLGREGQVKRFAVTALIGMAVVTAGASLQGLMHWAANCESILPQMAVGLAYGLLAAKAFWRRLPCGKVEQGVLRMPMPGQRLSIPVEDSLEMTELDSGSFLS